MGRSHPRRRLARRCLYLILKLDAARSLARVTGSASSTAHTCARPTAPCCPRDRPLQHRGRAARGGPRSFRGRSRRPRWQRARTSRARHRSRAARAGQVRACAAVHRGAPGTARCPACARRRSCAPNTWPNTSHRSPERPCRACGARRDCGTASRTRGLPRIQRRGCGTSLRATHRCARHTFNPPPCQGVAGRGIPLPQPMNRPHGRIRTSRPP